MIEFGVSDELIPRGSLGHNQTSGDHPGSGGLAQPALPLQLPTLYLEFCSAKDPRYVDIRKDHYVVYKGCHGQQLHFLIWYHGKIVGIISGASAVFASPCRDSFFKITPQNRSEVLNGIVDNVVFRLVCHARNLGSRVLSIWEPIAANLWEHIYGVPVFGFETFIVRQGLMREEVTAEKDARGRAVHRVVTVVDPEGNTRQGNIYKSANWMYLGETIGSTKGHDGVGLTGGLNGGKGGYLRKITPVKDVYGRWRPGHTAPILSTYQSSWRSGSADGTSAEKQRARQKTQKRQELLGKKIFMRNGKVIVA